MISGRGSVTQWQGPYLESMRPWVSFSELQTKTKQMKKPKTIIPEITKLKIQTEDRHMASF